LLFWQVSPGLRTRNTALIVETVGHLSRKRRRVPVGYLDDGGHIIVVGVALAATGSATRSQTRVTSGYNLRGEWRAARLHLIDADPESYLRRMNRLHAAFVRVESTTPAVVEIVLE
jgi:hypothetical protein